jgi:hypothetical protein
MENETKTEALADAVAALGLTVESVFVPFSQSRNAKDAKPWRSLNWRVTLKRDGRAILTTDYSAGEAHCPSYKQPEYPRTIATRERALMVAWECEHGRRAIGVRDVASAPYFFAYGPTAGPHLQPDALSVIYSLVTDADVIDEPNFTEWAHSLGYDPDSRKAEGVYRACLEIALQLRSGLGEEGLSRLRKAAQDY